MRVTVDAVGRIVIPKQLRSALGIGPDTELELQTDGGGLRLDPVGRRERPVAEQDGLPVLPQIDGVVLTDADVRQLRSDIQR